MFRRRTLAPIPGGFMPATALRRTSVAAIAAALALSLLSGCGTNTTTVCNVASSSSGCCGPGDAACPAAPAHLFTEGITGQVSSFPVAPGSGTLGTPTSVSGPTDSYGMAALSQQFLYAANRDLFSGSGI